MLLRGVSAFLLSLLIPSAALADRVVLGPVAGDRGGAIVRRLDRLLAARLDVIPWDEFQAGNHEVEDMADAVGVRRACRRVGARMIVLGDLRVFPPRGRALHLTALSCSSGMRAGDREVRLHGGPVGRRGLVDAVVTLLGEASDGGADDDEVPTTAPRRPSGVALLASSFARQDAWLAPGFDGASFDEEEEPTHRHPLVDTRAPTSAPTASIVEASAVLVFATRHLTVPVLGNSPIRHAGSGYAEVGVQGVILPIGLLVEAAWARTVGLTGALHQGVLMPSIDGQLETSAVDGHLGLVGRVELGTRPVFDLRPSLTWGWWGFAISPNPDVATFNYRFLRLGLEARVHLLDRLVNLGGWMGWRSVSEMGEATTTYGDRSEATGWDAGASVAVVLAHMCELSAGGELVQYDGVYAGTGRLADRPAVSSTDRYLRAIVKLGIIGR